MVQNTINHISTRGKPCFRHAAPSGADERNFEPGAVQLTRRPVPPMTIRFLCLFCLLCLLCLLWLANPKPDPIHTLIPRQGTQSSDVQPARQGSVRVRVREYECEELSHRSPTQTRTNHTDSLLVSLVSFVASQPRARSHSYPDSPSSHPEQRRSARRRVRWEYEYEELLHQLTGHRHVGSAFPASSDPRKPHSAR